MPTAAVLLGVIRGTQKQSPPSSLGGAINATTRRERHKHVGAVHDLSRSWVSGKSWVISMAQSRLVFEILLQRYPDTPPVGGRHATDCWYMPREVCAVDASMLCFAALRVTATS